MALFQCPECNNQVSDSASSCPHCGFPLSQYIKEKQFNSEVERLRNKIKPTEFECPEPRLQVCIRCATPFSRRTGKPLCKCQFPGVEVDYPEHGYRGELEQFMYIVNHDIVPRDIGDTESDEYIKCISEIQDANISRKEHGLNELTPIPPDPKDFGVKKEYGEPYKYVPPAPKPVPLLPHCPFCSSTNLTKISSVGKAVKISLFGLFGADDMGKTWRCNNCGGKF